jgi:hypothetical protein
LCGFVCGYQPLFSPTATDPMNPSSALLVVPQLFVLLNLLRDLLSGL